MSRGGTPFGDPVYKPLPAPRPTPPCCARCTPNNPFMLVCPECGNKRCPRASSHDNACTGSNEPGQRTTPNPLYKPLTTPEGGAELRAHTSPSGPFAAVPTPEFVRDLLSSDGRRRPGDDDLTGLGAALRSLDRELQMDVAAALYTYAVERLTVAAEAEERAKLIPPDEFRARNLVTAERLARLWRETCHARRIDSP